MPPRRAKEKGEFFARLLRYAAKDEKAVEVCLEVVLLSCSWNVVSRGKDKNVNVDTWKSWLAACFGKGDKVRDSAAGILEPLLEGMDRVWAPSDALKCSEILVAKMATASVSLSAMYRTAHKILSMSSVKRTPQFVLDYIRGSISQLDAAQLPADDLQVSLREAFEMAKTESRQGLADIVAALLDCEGYTASEKTSVVAGLRECDCFDSVCFQRLIDFWGSLEIEAEVVLDVARAVNAICEVRVRSCTWRAYVMKVPAALVSSVVERALECSAGGEIAELLRCFVYLRPLEREAFLRVSRHAQAVLVEDDGDHGIFSGGIHALVRSSVKFTGGRGGGDVFSRIEDVTLNRIASKLKEGTNGGLSADLMESVALLANCDGERAERSVPGLRSSLVRLLSSPDGGVRRNAIAALKDVTGAVVFGVMHEAEVLEASVSGYRERMAAVERLKNVEDGGHEEAVLRFLFGNLFVNFSLLWKPTIALIEEFSARLESKRLWEIVRDVYASTGDLPQFRGLVLQCLEAMSNTDEKTLRFAIDDFLDDFIANGDIGQMSRRKLVQRYARVFSRLQNVRSTKRFPELHASMATAAGEL